MVYDTYSHPHIGIHTMANYKRRQVMLSDRDVEAARKVGGGNVSAGLRMMIQADVMDRGSGREIERYERPSAPPGIVRAAMAAYSGEAKVDSGAGVDVVKTDDDDIPFD